MKKAVKIYFEGCWDEIISKKGFNLFSEMGIEFTGDLFLSPRLDGLNANSKPDLIIATNPNMDAAKFGLEHNIPVIFYTLFPDQIVGWDFANKRYKYEVSEDFKKYIKLCQKVLTNSRFTAELITKAWPDFVKVNYEVNYLGIDYDSIQKKDPRIIDKTIKVFWNHMWRKDKGFAEALTILVRLAEKYPKVKFILGRQEDWDPRGDFGERFAYTEFLKSITDRELKNIEIIKLLDVDEYFRFLKTVDIGFSTSHHETFGFGILELEAAGVACVVPDAEVYPEVHGRSILCEYNSIAENIAQLIEDRNLRLHIGEESKANAAKFTINDFASSLGSHILNLLNN